MNAIQSFLINFIENPKSTLTGLAGGSVTATAVYAAISQAHCDFTLVHWGAIAMAFLAPTAIGGVAQDSRDPGQKTRASDVPPVINQIPPKA